jgi:hypothetical protein
MRISGICLIAPFCNGIMISNHKIMPLFMYPLKDIITHTETCCYSSPGIHTNIITRPHENMTYSCIHTRTTRFLYPQEHHDSCSQNIIYCYTHRTIVIPHLKIWYYSCIQTRTSGLPLTKYDPAITSIRELHDYFSTRSSWFLLAKNTILFLYSRKNILSLLTKHYLFKYPEKNIIHPHKLDPIPVSTQIYHDSFHKTSSFSGIHTGIPWFLSHNMIIFLYPHMDVIIPPQKKMTHQFLIIPHQKHIILNSYQY